MSKKIFVAILFVSSVFGFLNAQDHFLVEFDAFSPPVKDMIRHYEGKKASPFMANDMHGVERYLGDYNGKTLVMWFWSCMDGMNLQQLDYMNGLSNEFKGSVNFVGFADEPTADVKNAINHATPEFPNICMSRIFSEAAYASDLGAGRIFVVDGTGVIRHVLPAELFQNDMTKAFSILKSRITSY